MSNLQKCPHCKGQHGDAFLCCVEDSPWYEQEICSLRQNVNALKESVSEREKQAAIKALEAAARRVNTFLQVEQNATDCDPLSRSAIETSRDLVLVVKTAVERDGLKALEDK